MKDLAKLQAKQIIERVDDFVSDLMICAGVVVESSANKESWVAAAKYMAYEGYDIKMHQLSDPYFPEVFKASLILDRYNIPIKGYKITANIHTFSLDLNITVEEMRL